MRDLMSGYGECRQQPERKVRQKSRGNQHAVERVVDAVANDDKNTRGSVTTMVVVMVPIVVMPVGVRVPPQHRLLNYEKDTEPEQERHPDGVGTLRPNTLHGLRQQREQSRTQQ